MKKGMALIDDILNHKSLQQGPRAFLLLKLCRLARIVRPDKAEEYWQKLREERQNLPMDYAKDYGELEDVMDPDKKGKDEDKKGFKAEILREIELSREKIEENPGEAVKGFQACEERLEKRKWPFGKKAAWNALITAWADVSPEDAVRLIKKASKLTQKEIIRKLNGKTPLTPEQWDRIYKNIGGKTTTIIKEYLDDPSDFSLNLPPMLAESVASDIELADIIFDREMVKDKDAEKGYDKFEIFVFKINEHNPPLAGEIVGEFFRLLTVSSSLEKDFQERFSFLKRAMRIWAQVSESPDDVLAVIIEKTPEYLRDFAVSHWLSLVAENEKDAAANLEKLSKKASDLKSAEEYFLKNLVANDRGEIAWKLAGESANKEDLFPKLRKAIVRSKTETAHKLFKLDDFKDDLIGSFFYQSEIEKKIEFLREQTDKGSKNLPSALWKKPTVDEVLEKRGDSLYQIYLLTTEKEDQFKEHLRLFMTYNHENLDLFLLYTLVKWSEKHPAEVKSLLKKMWKVMTPDDSDLRADVLRNAIFERCRDVFAAGLDTLKEFINWIKAKLVDNVYQHQVGETIYSLSLKEETLFLFCLMSVEKVKGISWSKAEEILKYALGAYKAEKKHLELAAAFCAGQKGLYAIEPPVELEKKKKLDNWQVGVIDASAPTLLEALIQKQ